MKLYDKIAGFTLCGLMCLSSCQNWDFDTDSSYDRLFRTPKIETLELDATFVNLQWNKVPKADYYVVDLSKDSLTFNTELKSFGADQSITANTYQIAKLLGGTRYSVRIKAFSQSGIQESEYAVLTFKTKTEQILNEVTAITGKSATITWEAGLEVNKLVIAHGSDKEERVLTAAEIAEGVAMLTGLSASTEYVVTIYLDEVARGKRTFSTTESFPDGYTVVTLKTTDLLSDVLAAQTGKVVIVFPLGSDIQQTEATINTIPDHLTSIIFWGATGGTERARFSPKGLAATGTLEQLKFYNLTLYNAGADADYVLNQNVPTTISTFSIENCEVKDTRGVIRVQGAGDQSTIEQTEFVNCVFTNIGSYGLINTKGMTNLRMSHILMAKSTFNTLNTSAVINLQQDDVQITMDKCTFYKFVTKGKPFIDVNKLTTIRVDVKNSLFGQYFGYEEGGNIKAGSIKDIFTAENVYSTQDCPWAAGYELGSTHAKMSVDFFEAADNGNFKVKDPTFTAIAGDPRWAE